MYGRFEQEDLLVNAKLREKTTQVYVLGTYLKESNFCGKFLSFSFSLVAFEAFFIDA